MNALSHAYSLSARVELVMATNEGWPEAFGFSIAGGDPCIISKVEDGGSAQEAGLQACLSHSLSLSLASYNSYL